MIKSFTNYIYWSTRFNIYFNQICKINPPSRKELSGSLLENVYYAALECLQRELKYHNVKSVALTSDGWSARDREHFICTNIHYITKDWILKTDTILEVYYI